MATLGFLPFKEGDVYSSDNMNALVQSIIDGTIFSPTAISIVPGLISPLAARVATLESEVTVLQSFIQSYSRREQFILTAGQSSIGLAHAPNIDSELLFLKGSSLARSGLPIGSVHDYSISGSTITLEAAVSTAVAAGDILIVVYQSGV